MNREDSNSEAVVGVRDARMPPLGAMENMQCQREAERIRADREDYEKQGGKPANTILFDESSAQSGINRSKGAQRRGWERPAWQQGEGREGDRPRGMSVTRVRVRTWSRRVRPPCHQQTGVPSGERGSRPWRRLRQRGLSLDAWRDANTAAEPAGFCSAAARGLQNTSLSAGDHGGESHGSSLWLGRFRLARGSPQKRPEDQRKFQALLEVWFRTYSFHGKEGGGMTVKSKY